MSPKNAGGMSSTDWELRKHLAGEFNHKSRDHIAGPLDIEGGVAIY